MNRSLIRWGLFFLSVLAATLLWGCGAPTQPAQTPVVVTVVNTVPVEVTRIVQVLQTVEVTREVVVAQTVLAPVTTTPEAIPTATPTPPATNMPTLPANQATVVWIPTRPPVKVNGISYFKITNATNVKAEVLFNGPVYRSFIVGGGTSLSTSLQWGSYTYQVLKEGKIVFNGEMRLVNSDKYELIIFEDHVMVLTP